MPPPFPVSMNRSMPLPSNGFLVYFGQSTSPVALVKKVSKLGWTIEPHEYRCGGSLIAFTGPGRVKRFDSIKFERGLSYAPEFREWASAALLFDKGAPTRNLKDNFRNLRIEVRTEDNKLALRFLAWRCWVSDFQALPELDADSNSVAIESLTVEHHGFEQDTTVPPPD